MERRAYVFDSACLGDRWAGQPRIVIEDGVIAAIEDAGASHTDDVRITGVALPAMPGRIVTPAGCSMITVTG